jgi:hypothetical protein
MAMTSYSKSKSVSATTSTSTVALPGGQGGQLEIVNLGTAAVTANLGASGVTAVALDSTARNGILIPPGAVIGLDVGNSSHIALLAASGTQTIVLMSGTE